MKYKITKKQLRSLTDPQVKEMFPDAFKVELEVGRWYRNKDKDFENIIACVTKLHGDNRQFSGYGFDRQSKFRSSEESIFWGADEWRLATNQEVSEALINEAKKRGYKKGVISKFGSVTKTRKIESDEYLFHKEILFLGYDTIFWKGIWTEIIEEPIFEYLEEVEVSYRTDYSPSFIVRYGCKSPDGSYICFDKDSSEPRRFKYIKKINL